MKNILLIEDNLEMRENTAEILELAGYQVISGENGKIGVDLATRHLPDLIICDVMMPELDGYGVLHILSKHPKTAGIPFIFLTAKAEKEDFRKGMNLGADDYITKPFNDVELLDAIETRFRKTDLIKKEFAKNAEGLEDFMNKAESFDALIKLTGDRKCKVFKKKDPVFSEGNYPVGVWFISKGKVKTFKSNEDGKEYITGLYKEGDFIGYTAILEDSNLTESAAALEESEICLIQRQDFLTLLYTNREVANKFIKLLSDNLVEKEERLLSLAYNSVRKRVAEALLMLRERYKEDNKDEFSMHISREDLSNIVGTATESLIRTLSDFKEEGLIELKAGLVRIVDARKLEHMKF
ncbi:MAG: response regulator [Bacteroidetes bacterium]|nr:response regulator [Bacteroidota bacterium]MBL0071570.1 response regulator [Bacteroidota bacterium]